MTFRKGTTRTLTVPHNWKLISCLVLVLYSLVLISIYEETNKKDLATDLIATVSELDTIKSTMVLTRNLDYVAAYNNNRNAFEENINRFLAASTPEQAEISVLIEVSAQYTATFDAAVMLLKSSTLPSEELDNRLADNLLLTQAYRERLLGLLDHFNDKKRTKAEKPMSVFFIF